MKANKYNGLKLLIIILLGYCPGIFSQQTVKFQPEGSSMQINGTSNLHDWQEVIEKFNVSLVFSSDNKVITGIDKITFTCKATSLISDNSIMTNKTHNALKVEQHPDIKFIFSELDQFQNNGSLISGSVTGNLTLAGVVKKITLPFKGSISSDMLTLKGSKQLNMTDFKIDPPTAMLGVLKTGEMVELVYSLQFQIN